MTRSSGLRVARQGNRLFLLLAAAAMIAAALLSTMAAPAAAQSADRVAANLNDSGVFVEDGAEGSSEDFEQVIAALAGVGLDLHVASLSEDDPDIEAFARSLRDKTGGTVLVITPGQLAGASDTFSDSEVGRAIDQSFDAFGGSVEAGALAFGEALVGRAATAGSTASTATTSAPATTAAATPSEPTSTAEPSGGGSGAGLLIFLVVVVGGIVLLVLFLRRKNRKRVGDELAQRRAVVGEELEAIGVEILDLSDKMSVTDDDEAVEHYRDANREFLELKERLEAATSLWEVTEIDHEADETAWHLDAAAALLEDEPVPAKPERPTTTPPTQRVPAAPRHRTGSREVPEPTRPNRRDDGRQESRGSETRDRDDSERDDPASSRSQRAADRERVESRLDRRERRTSDRVSPRQDRRSNRRSNWSEPKTTGGNVGGAVGGVLKNVLVGGVLGGGGRSKPPRSWNGAGTVDAPPRPRSSPGRAPTRRSSARSGGSASRQRGGSASRSRGGGGSASRRR